MARVRQVPEAIAVPANPLWPVLAEEGRNWIYLAKTLTASLLALYLAYWLELDSPRSAMLTVVIVMQPQSGMVLAKSFYRILGTLVGCLAAIFLLALFADRPLLFFLGLAAWVGFCTAGAARYRNFQAYGFVLAGYTACLIALPVLAGLGMTGGAVGPAAVFAQASGRFVAVVMGILVASVISEMILPQRLTALLGVAVRQRFATLERLAHGALRHTADHAAIAAWQRGLGAEIIGMESFRSVAVFEDSEIRERSSRLSLLNATFMSVYTTFHGLYRLTRRLDRTESGRAVLAALQPVSDQLASQLLVNGCAVENPAGAKLALPRLIGFQRDMPAMVNAAQARLIAGRANQGDFTGFDPFRDFDVAVHLLRRFAEDLATYTETYASLADRRSQPRFAGDIARFVPRTDGLLAVVAAIRAILTILGLTLFWQVTSWPSAPGAIIIGSISSALFAAQANPVRAVGQMAAGFALAFIGGYLLDFLVLPGADGFTLMAVLVAPFWLLALSVTLWRDYAGIGMGFLLFLGSSAIPDNLPAYDPARYLNDGLAQFFGLGAASLAFVLIFPAGGRLARWRLRHNLRRLASDTCVRPLPGLQQSFESGTHDLLFQLSSMPRLTPADHALYLREALALLMLGRTVIAFRATLAAAGLGPDAVSVQALTELARCFRQPSASHHAAAASALTEAVGIHSPTESGVPRLSLLRLVFIRDGLVDERAALLGLPPDSDTDPTSEAA